MNNDNEVIIDRVLKDLGTDIWAFSFQEDSCCSMRSIYTGRRTVKDLDKYRLKMKKAGYICQFEIEINGKYILLEGLDE